MPYDLFMSYARKDNAEGRVTDLVARIEADYRGFAGEELRCFFDLDDIHGMEDWRHRILEGLRHSSLLLLVLSPAYIRSPYCEWEIVEYLKYEHARAALGQGVAPVYFVELPGAGHPDFPAQEAAWLAQVRRRNRFDLRPWSAEGAEALKRQDVRTRLEDLERSLHERLSKLRRLAAAPGNLPAHNPRFVGRELEMQRLHGSAGLGVFGILTALQGMGGLGKTALAIQYACAYADFYPGGRWLLGCAERSNLAGMLRELDVDLGLELTEVERRDDRRAAKRVLAELERRARAGATARAGEPVPPEPRVLLLLDNVDDPALLQPPESDLLTGKRWLHVLATTRLDPDALGHDPERQTLLIVDELPADDALRLIESHQPGGHFPAPAEHSAAAEIVRRLGGFTLAVEVVAVYLGECAGRVSCGALLQRLHDEGLQGVEGIARSTRRALSHVEKLIGATLTPTLDLLSPAESQVVAYAALLPSDRIPLPWLRTLAGQDHPELTQDAAPGYSDPWLDLVNRLLGLRLLQIVDVDPDTQAPRLVRMHRLVGELVRGRDARRAAALWERLTEKVRTRCNAIEQSWHEQQWEIPPLIAQTHALLDRADPEAPRVVRALCQWLPRFDSGRQSEVILRACLAQEEADPSTVPTNMAVTLSNLGWASQALGRAGEAEGYLRRALAIDEQARPVDEHALAIRCNQLGSCLMALGRVAEAQSYCRRAVQLAEQVLGVDHPDTLTAVNDLAYLMEIEGAYVNADPLYRRVLETRERVLGPEHPDTLTSVNNLAALLTDEGDSGRAESLYRRALDARQRVLGSEHPDTLHSLNNLAVLLQSTSDYTKATHLFRRALEAQERALGPEHPDTLITLNNLAHLLARTGESVQADALYRRGLEAEERVVGPEHPDTLTIVNNLACLRAGEGDYADAELLFQRALAGREKALGPAHPDTLSSLNNLAFLLQAKGDVAGAEPLHRQALSGRETVLGADHPDTLASVQALANLLENTARHAEARPLRLRRIEALAARPNTPALELIKMASDAFLLGESGLATELLERVLKQGFERSSNHCHLAQIALLTGDGAAASNHATQAWAHRAEGATYLTPRILWLQLACRMLADARTARTQPEPRVLLGRLKTALQADGAHLEWAMTPMLDHLKPRLSPPDHALLIALVAALSDADQLAALDELPGWRNAAPDMLP